MNTQAQNLPKAYEDAYWGGDGNPPVGCECECEQSMANWVRCIIVAHDNGKIVYRPTRDSPKQLVTYRWQWGNRDKFRPLVSEKDYVMGEIIDIITENGIIAPDGPEVQDIADRLYRAGCRVTQNY